MPRPIEQKLSQLNVSAQEEVLIALSREFFPVVTQLRDTVNAELVNSGQSEQVEAETTGDTETEVHKVIQGSDGPVLPDSGILRVVLKIWGIKGANDTVHMRIERRFERDGDAIVTDDDILDTPNYSGTLTTATADLAANASNEVVVNVTGEADTAIRWSGTVWFWLERAY